jgi:hypothetical protein
MDHGGPAVGHVSALDQVAKLALGKAGHESIAQRQQTAVAQRGADAHPIDLLRRLDHAQPHVRLGEIDEGPVPLREPRMLIERERPDDAHASGACTAGHERGGRGADRGLAAPGDFGALSELPRQRQMIEVLDEERIRPSGRQHAHRLGGDRPLGEPLHRRSGAVEAAIDEMIERVLRQHVFDGGAPPLHLGGGKPRIFGFVNVLKMRRKGERH